MRYPQTLSGDTTLELPEFDAPPSEPIELLRTWLATAEAAQVREPRAATFATADNAGRVATRIVFVKDITDAGILLGFSTRSRKGRDITVNPHASLNFYWRERAQQISVSGTITRGDRAASDAMFATRVRAAQALANRSDQSHPASVEDLDRLRESVTEVAAGTAALSRPAAWWAWTLRPDEIEFWHADPGRFHRRLRYQRRGDGYRHDRLQP